MSCTRCLADPQPASFASARNCAFDGDGDFKHDNWNCATIEALLEFTINYIYGEDESMQVIPIDGGDHGGFIVLTRYKRRGKTSSGVWVGDFWPAKRLTLDVANFAIAGGERARRIKG